MKALLFILFSVSILIAQSQTKQQQIFAVNEFINQVKQFHPVAKQANLQIDKAKAELTSAKGAFDPIAGFNASRKTFNGKNYYYYTNPELKIPLPVGDIKTGLENNGGNYLSSEESVGKTSYLGIELPLAKGLILDKRRAVLQQAKIFQKQSEQERLKMLNDLLYNAYVTYIQWAGAYQLNALYSRYLQISNDRVRLVKISTANGDKSFMDTLEAYTQVQNFQLLQSDALMKLNTASLDLSGYLWQQNDSTYLVSEYYIPDTAFLEKYTQNISSLDDMVNTSLQTNPAVLSYNSKIEILEVERKLKKQSLLPTINAKANLLSKDYLVLKGISTTMLENNYKWGVDFKIPIFLREARGDYAKAKLKIDETNLDLTQKKWEIENKVRNYFNEFVQLQQQLKTIEAAYNNYNSLYKNELLKFNNGESSLFLVNAREIKSLEALQKTIELKVKFFKAKYSIEWAAGVLR